jgi:hypothetical protein
MKKTIATALTGTALTKRDKMVLRDIIDSFPVLADDHMFLSRSDSQDIETKKTLDAGFHLTLVRDKELLKDLSDGSCPKLNKHSDFISVASFLGDYVVYFDSYHWHVEYTPTYCKMEEFDQWRKDHKDCDSNNDEKFSMEWRSEAKQICDIINDIVSENVVIESFWGEKDSELIWLQTSLIHIKDFNKTRVLPIFNSEYTQIIRKIKSWNGTYNAENTY